jgi:hypothetical protein
VGVVQMPPCLRDPKRKFGLTRLLHLALLSRFTRMSQLHPSEINFERQPSQIRAVCDSEQDFRNAGGRILRRRSCFSGSAMYDRKADQGKCAILTSFLAHVVR